MPKDRSLKIVSNNKKAFHDYEILETYEAGLVLTGTEVKSVLAGRINLKNTYIDIKDGEAFLIGCHIPEYELGNRFNHEPMRTKKLLLHKKEIVSLSTKVKQDGLTIVATKAYFSNGKVKVEIGLAKGKKNYDKRQDIAKKDAERSMQRSLSPKY